MDAEAVFSVSSKKYKPYLLFYCWMFTVAMKSASGWTRKVNKRHWKNIKHSALLFCLRNFIYFCRFLHIIFNVWISYVRRKKKSEKEEHPKSEFKMPQSISLCAISFEFFFFSWKCSFDLSDVTFIRTGFLFFSFSCSFPFKYSLYFAIWCLKMWIVIRKEVKRTAAMFFFLFYFIYFHFPLGRAFKSSWLWLQILQN